MKSTNNPLLMKTLPKPAHQAHLSQTRVTTMLSSLLVVYAHAIVEVVVFEYVVVLVDVFELVGATEPQHLRRKEKENSKTLTIG